MDPAARQLLDRRAIADLLFDYCATLDTLALEDFAALFTEDCDVRYGTVALCGVVALMEYLDKALRSFAAHHHHVTNLKLEFEHADRARGRSYIQAWHAFPPEKQRPDLILHGRYHSEFARTPDGWRISVHHGSEAGDDRERG